MFGSCNSPTSVKRLMNSLFWRKKVLLIGNSATGKSTLVNHIRGALPPTCHLIVEDESSMDEISYKLTQWVDSTVFYHCWNIPPPHIYSQFDCVVITSRLNGKFPPLPSFILEIVTNIRLGQSIIFDTRTSKYRQMTADVNQVTSIGAECIN